MSRKAMAMARRVPRQERSRKLVAAVREACRQILAEEGHEGLTTARIAERAGVSVGSLYQYFENKEHVLREVVGETWDTQRTEAARWNGPLQRASLREQIREGLEHAITHFQALLDLDTPYVREHHGEYRLDRDFPVAAPATTPPEDGSTPPPETDAVDYTRRNLERNRAELRPERRERIDLAAFLIGRGIPAILHEAIAEDPALLSDPAFAEELTELMTAYLVGADR